MRKAYDDIIQRVHEASPEAHIAGVVVSAMAAPGLELILGMHRDPQFGPVVLFGLGGVTVELFRDISLRLLPINRTEAQSMLGEIKAAPLLKGFRGNPPVDLEALTDGLLKLAQIAEEHPDIIEIDLNPVFAYPEGMVVVDARILKA